MAKSIYKEKQRSKVWDVLIISAILFLSIVGRAAKEVVNPGDQSVLVFGLCMFSLLLLGALLAKIYFMKSKISVTEKSLKVKMGPWPIVKEKINWKDVKSMKIVETPILAQWHGGNINFKEQQLSVVGRNGLHLKTFNGKEYFVGSKNIEKLKDAITSVFDTSMASLT